MTDSSIKGNYKIVEMWKENLVLHYRTNDMKRMASP